MELLPFIIVLVIAVLIFYFFKLKKQSKSTGSGPEPSPQRLLPSEFRENDKLVLIEGANYSDLKAVILGFCSMYNEKSYAVLPRVFKISETNFAITFPYDIEFEIYCYLINYMYYPIEIRWTATITGWTTMSANDEWVTEKSLNKKVMLFVPADDSEHDNVYMTTSDNIGHKLGFAVGDEKKLLDMPKKYFFRPHVEIADLNVQEFEDIR